MEERYIGFIQGVIYSASSITEYKLNGISLLEEAGFKIEDVLKYGEKSDLFILGLVDENNELILKEEI